MHIQEHYNVTVQAFFKLSGGTAWETHAAMLRTATQALEYLGKQFHPTQHVAPSSGHTADTCSVAS